MGRIKIKYLQSEDVNERYLRLMSYLSPVSMSVEQARDVFSHIKNSNRDCFGRPVYTIIIAVDGYQPVGSATLMLQHRFAYDGKPVAHIEDVVVHEQYRNLGIAKQLVGQLIGEAKMLGCYKVILSCSDKLTKMYSSFGFYKHENQMRLDL